MDLNYKSAEIATMLPWPSTASPPPPTHGCIPPSHWDPTTVTQFSGAFTERTLDDYAAQRGLDLSIPEDVNLAFYWAGYDASRIQGFRLIIVGRAAPYVVTKRIRWFDCANFEIVGVRGEPVGPTASTTKSPAASEPRSGPLPRILFRSPNIDETSDTDNGQHLMILEKCQQFRIANIILDGNRTKWDHEEYESGSYDGDTWVGIVPYSRNNLTLINCQDFVVEQLQSRRSRGNDIALYARDPMDSSTFCRRGVIRDSTLSAATDSSLLIAAAQSIWVEGCNIEYPNHGQTCAGVQCEGATIPRPPPGEPEPPPLQASPGYSDIVIYRCVIRGCYRGVHLNGRWDSGGVTIRDNQFIGGSAREDVFDGLASDDYSDIPPGYLTYIAEHQDLDGPVTGAPLSYGIICGARDVVIVDNSFVRYDNQNFRTPAVIYIQGIYCRNTWIVRNKFVAIHQRRIWNPDSPVGSTPTSQVLVPIVQSMWVPGPIITYYNVFAPPAAIEPYPTTHGYNGFLVYSPPVVVTPDGPVPITNRYLHENAQLFQRIPAYSGQFFLSELVPDQNCLYERRWKHVTPYEPVM